jgi:hypothetical protein
LPRFQVSRPTAVLLDASMEEGLALARSLRANRPNLRLVGFGVAGGANSFIACAESGLVAFVDRNWHGERTRDCGPGRASRRAEMLAPRHRDDLRSLWPRWPEPGTRPSSR